MIVFCILLLFLLNSLILPYKKVEAGAFAGAVPAGIVGAGGAYVLGALAVGGLARALGLEYADEIKQHANRVWQGSSDLAKKSLQSGLQVASDSGSFLVNAGSDFWNYVSMKASDLASGIASSITSKELDSSLAEIDTTNDMGGYYAGSPLTITTKHPDAMFSNYHFDTNYNAPGNHRFWYYIEFPQEIEKFFYASLSTKDINKQGGIIGFKKISISVRGVHDINVTLQNAVTELVDNPDRLNSSIIYSFNSQELHDLLASAFTVEDVIDAVNYAIDNLSAPSYVNNLVVGDLSTYVTFQTALDKINQDLDSYRTGGIGIPISETVPLTNTGEPLTYDETNSAYIDALGNPYVGDIDYTLPQVIPKEIDGVRVDTIPYEGSYVDIKTGDIVAPLEDVDNPVIPPTDPPVEDNPSNFDLRPLMLLGDLIKSKFPFSIPWDVFNLFNTFNVEPVTPVFKIDSSDGINLGGHNILVDYDFNIDFSIFDSIARIIRWGMIIVFDICIVLALRRLTPD